MRIKLARFFLLQLCSIEDFDAFDKALRRLFSKTSADRLQDLHQGMKTLSGVSWSYVGHIVRMKPYSGELAIIEELPAEIEDISVQVQQVLPSLFVLAFGVRLAEKPFETADEIVRSQIPGQVGFNHWLPFTLWNWGPAQEVPEFARERAISCWIKTTRGKAQQFLSQYFPSPIQPKEASFAGIDEFHLMSQLSVHRRQR